MTKRTFRPRTEATPDEHRLTEIPDPQGGRNRIREGDAVKIDPNIAEKSRWEAIFKYAETDSDGDITSVTVFGAPGFDAAAYRAGKLSDRKRAPAIRSVLPERVHRMSQSHINRRADLPEDNDGGPVEA